MGNGDSERGIAELGEENAHLREALEFISGMLSALAYEEPLKKDPELAVIYAVASQNPGLVEKYGHWKTMTQNRRSKVAKLCGDGKEAGGG